MKPNWNTSFESRFLWHRPQHVPVRFARGKSRQTFSQRFFRPAFLSSPLQVSKILKYNKTTCLAESKQKTKKSLMNFFFVFSDEIWNRKHFLKFCFGRRKKKNSDPFFFFVLKKAKFEKFLTAKKWCRQKWSLALNNSEGFINNKTWPGEAA